jgi:hypothetical protein
MPITIQLSAVKTPENKFIPLVTLVDWKDGRSVDFTTFNFTNKYDTKEEALKVAKQEGINRARELLGDDIEVVFEID